ATRGATEESTTHDRRAPPQPADAARAPAPARPQLAPLLRRSALGVVDRRPDGDRPHPARAAHGPADPLDAEPAGPRAADEGDPAEVQGRQAEAERGADALLPGEPHQPGLVVPSARRAVPGLHRALLHAARLLEAPALRRPLVEVLRRARRLLLAPRRPEHRRARQLALVRLPAARDLRDQPDGVDVPDGHDDGQDPADA